MSLILFAHPFAWRYRRWFHGDAEGVQASRATLS
jgi:hypothetical protein